HDSLACMFFLHASHPQHRDCPEAFAPTAQADFSREDDKQSLAVDMSRQHRANPSAGCGDSLDEPLSSVCAPGVFADEGSVIGGEAKGRRRGANREQWVLVDLPGLKVRRWVAPVFIPSERLLAFKHVGLEPVGAGSDRWDMNANRLRSSRHPDELLNVPLLESGQALRGPWPIALHRALSRVLLAEFLIFRKIEHEELMSSRPCELVIQKWIDHQEIPANRFIRRVHRRPGEIQLSSQSRPGVFSRSLYSSLHLLKQPAIDVQQIRVGPLASGSVSDPQQRLSLLAREDVVVVQKLLWIRSARREWRVGV